MSKAVFRERLLGSHVFSIGALILASIDIVQSFIGISYICKIRLLGAVHYKLKKYSENGTYCVHYTIKPNPVSEELY